MKTIVIAAYGMEKSIVCNFAKWNNDVFSELGFDIITVSDKNFKVGFNNCRVVKYPAVQKKFSIPKTINYGIRQVSHEGLVIKSDPDIFFSKAVLKHVVDSVSKGNGMVCHCSNIDSVESAVKDSNWVRRTKRHRGRGACFAMMKSDWESLCGYNEKIWGWGGDDNDMWTRATRKIKMVENSEFPLYHINHEKRKGSEFFPTRGNSNLKVGSWNNPNWGSGGI
jgi:hypothetical protein